MNNIINHKNICTEVVGKNLCHGCGICQAVCPGGAIKMEVEQPGFFVPNINKSKCSSCGLCLKGCSGRVAFGSNSLIGNVTGVWTGHAIDEQVRQNSSSGGIVSAILIKLLESNAIDAAVICGPDKEYPVRGKSFVARTRDEVTWGAKSIYGMTEIGSALKRAVDDKDINKIAVVGLPCQVASLRYALDIIPRLKSKIFITIGLMEGHNVYHKATEYAIGKCGIKVKDVTEFRYRDSGWSPFSVKCTTKENALKFLWNDFPFRTIWDGLLMIPRRCLLCNDFASESADIAVSDAWLEEYKGNKKGYSIVLSHTKYGAGLIQSLINSACLELKLSDISVIGRSQYCQLDFKKRTIAARAKLFGAKKWLDGKCIGNLSIADYLFEALMIFNNKVLRSAPFLIWQIYLVSFCEKCMARLISKITNLFKHKDTVTGKKSARFDPDILKNYKEHIQ